MVAPVVATKTSVTLADHLDLRNLPLATTPGGKAFAIKSLHPADSEIKTVRGPGGLYPSLGIAFDSIMTLEWPEGATYAIVIQWPNLQVPFNVQFYAPHPQADTYGYGDYVIKNVLILNKALDTTAGAVGENLSTLLGSHFPNIHTDIDAYRVLSQSITCDLIAPSIADQGTILSAQFVDRPRTVNQSALNWSYSSSAPHDVWSNTLGGFVADCWIYDQIPDPENLVMGTTAYNGAARLGFYQPLKIDKFDFVSVDDPMYFLSPDSESPPSALTLDKAVCHMGGMWDEGPHYGNYPICTKQGWDSSDHTRSSASADYSILKPSGHAIGYTKISGTSGSPNVSLRFRFRQVSEVIPVLGKRYAALAEAPLPPDDLSYRMIREIGARLKDAYPSSYNAEGKLRDTIVKIGKGLLKYADPALTLVSTLAPSAAPIIAGARTALAGAQMMVKEVKRQRKRRRRGSAVAAAPVQPSRASAQPPPRPPNSTKPRGGRYRRDSI